LLVDFGENLRVVVGKCVVAGEVSTTLDDGDVASRVSKFWVDESGAGPFASSI